MENTETKSRRPVLLYLLLALLTLAAAAGTTLSALAFTSSREALQIIDQRLPEAEDDTPREDDVTIAGSYVIRSTRDLSDAYRSGDTSALDDKQRETLDMAAAALEEMALEGLSAFEQEKAVYDWMTHNLQQDRGLLTVIPTTQADCDNPYGVLKYHNAVCVGYATTFRLFMEMLDIPCMVVHTTTLYHSWDLVQLDGNWYHTDIYSDAGTGGYTCFNLNDTMMTSRGVEWDTSFYPAATSLEYNMANRNSVEGVDALELPAALRKAIEDKTAMLAFRYGADFTEEEAQKASEALSQVQQLLWNLQDFNGASIISYTFNPTGDGYLLVISFYYSEQGEAELSEEDREQISQSVNQTFADLTGWVDETAETEGDYETDEPMG